MESEARGKVLIVGGYLVLYPQYFGIVTTCSAKIRCYLQELPETQQKITIKSPRFSLSSTYDIQQGTFDSECNSFISESLKCALYFLHLKGKKFNKNIIISIEADEEFYGTGKTGLGSSAALVTSLIKVLFMYHSENDLPYLHFVCQIAHFRAQEKIGSGFDVSAAVYGSQYFQRYICPIIPALLDNLNTDLTTVLQSISNWPIPKSFILPYNYHILLCSCIYNENR